MCLPYMRVTSSAHLQDACAAEPGLFQLALALLVQRDGLESLLLHLPASDHARRQQKVSKLPKHDKPNQPKKAVDL